MDVNWTAHYHSDWGIWSHRRFDICQTFSGSKLDLEMERGIFVGTVPNTVLQKLLHRSIYSTIDQNLGDSNVGGRKGKNIRSHSFNDL